MMKDNLKQQPWLGKPLTDIVFILLPPFASLLVVFLFPGSFQNNKDMPDNWWVLLILLIDVAHVYSTLYRTYFDKEIYQKQKTMMWAIPVIGFIASVLLYNLSYLIFWRVLAYLAVFHFVRQQYGFMRLYSRKEDNPSWMKLIDKTTIYYATLFPIIYWHFSGPRNFNWFVEGDFLSLNSSFLLTVASALYVSVLLLYLSKEIYLITTSKKFNVPRTAVITGTIVSWYFGIIYFNGDMAFTVLNVVSHGVPYMALVWIYGKKQNSLRRLEQKKVSVFFTKYGLILFLGLIFLLAYIEEGLWDSALWKEHQHIFGIFYLSSVNWDSTALSIIIPLLALPQVTHYIIDGFIWKIKPRSEQHKIEI